MEQVKDSLRKRKAFLEKIKTDKVKALRQVTEGSLRISKSNGKTQYYLRIDPKDHNGTYIREDNLQFVKELAQKDYDKKILTTAQKELTAINKFLSAYPDIKVEQIYKKLHEKRQELINPIMESDEEYIKRWESTEYQALGFKKDTQIFYTARGEKVRSKTEVIIADTLDRKGVPYRYECPICIPGRGMYYPDFTVLNIHARKEILWEHLGMMDNPEYAEKAIQKLNLYSQNGFFQGENLIVTYETRKTPVNQKLIQLIIDKYFIHS